MSAQRIQIELLEDLHIGTGTGYGDIDSLQVRDRNGWPVLPASHLKGLWRDVARQILPKQVGRLFGRAGDQRGQVQLTSAYTHAPVRTLIWGSTAIDDTGKAEEKSLRFIEYVPAGTPFELQVCAPDADWESLKKILGRCTHLGRGRRRGYGKVRWQIPNDGASVQALQLERPPAFPAFPARLRLHLRNLDPLCLPRTGHPGNLIASDAFIRGRTLRGAIVSACLTQGLQTVAQQLLSETLCWGDALPLPDKMIELQHIEVLPIPLSIGTPKAKATGTLPWWASAPHDDVLGARGEVDQIALEVPHKEKLKRPKEDEFLFRAHPDKPWRRYRPQLLERLHTRVPSEENNFEQALFSTEEIAENTSFIADLLVFSEAEGAALQQAIQQLSGQWLHVGRGGRPVVIEAAMWLPPAAHEREKQGGFTLLLTSDLLVRDRWGNYHDRLSEAALRDLLGEEGKEGEDPQDWQIARNFSEARDHFGFNALTGLPRAAQRAIKAGSIVRIEGKGSAQLRERLCQRPVLGENPEEGFGRFVINAQPQPQADKNAEQVLNVAYEKSSEEVLCQEAKDWVKRFGRVLTEPSPSQWGEWRSRSLASRTPEELLDSFARLDAAKDKQGGKAWQGFVNHPEFEAFKQTVRERSLADACLLLEFFLRWQRAHAVRIKESAA